MIVERIRDLKFKRGDIFENKDIYLKNDSMYISKDFAYLINNNKDIIRSCIILAKNSKKERYFLVDKITVKEKYSKILVSMFLYTNVLSTNSKICDKLKVCGLCGDFGFGGIQLYKSKTLGVKFKRQVYKKLLDLYFESSLCRSEKLKEILEL
jgi:hypothetical protein